MPVDRLMENGDKVWALQNALAEGSVGLNDVPLLIRRVVDEERWQQRIDRITGDEVRFQTFGEFLSKTPPNGLGSDLRTIKRLCLDDPIAIDAIDRITQRSDGRPTAETFNNVKGLFDHAPVGNAAQAAVRRLRKDRPDLHQRVLAGELSPHAAMKEAGFRPPTAIIRTDDIRAAASTIRRHFTGDRLHELIEALDVEH